MQPNGRELSIGDQGDDVRLLQDELTVLNLAIPVAEHEAAVFDRGTHRAVMTFQRRAGLEPTGTVDQETAKRLSAEVEGGGGQPPKGEFVVRGRIVNAGGEPLESAVVRASDRDLRSEELLGEAVTDAGGRYEIRYPTDRFSRDEEASVNLVVRAFNPDGRERAASPIRFNASSDETVDLVVDGEQLRGPSEWDLLLTRLSPLLQDLPFAELTEDDQHRDVTFLSGETGEDVGRITLVIAAHRLMAQTDVPAEAFYAMLRKGLPTSLEALLAQSTEVLRRALVRSADANIVPAQVGGEADAILERLRSAAVRQALRGDQPDRAAPAAIGQVLGVTLGEPELREEFLAAYLAHQGPVEEFWQTIASRPQFGDRLEELQVTVQLGTLAANHMPLVEELQRMRGAGELTAIAELTRMDEAAWREVLARDPGAGPIGAPERVPGENADEKVTNYARALSRQVEDAFPTAFVARRLEGDNFPGRDDLVSFLDANASFDLRATRLTTYLEEHPAALAGVTDPDRAAADLQALQRVYRLAPRYDQASALLKAGVDSAHAISRMGENVFLARFGDALGGALRAKTVYAKAHHVQAIALNLAVEYGLASAKAPTRAAPDEAVLEVEGVPEWSTLFGSLELCGCEDCRSVHSPAAYLTDTLHFLAERPAKVDGRTAKDVLFARRPDLGEIELTCENTNTPLPYVDLVNEALEQAVAPPPPFTPFTLPAAVEDDLSSRRLSQTLREAFHPQLSTEAVISVGVGRPRDHPPDRWAIDEPAFTYTIRKDDRLLRVEARSLQTKGSAAERAASPQYVGAAAYATLGRAIWPWSLPFDLWAEEAAAYLAHLGVPRYELQERLLSGGRGDILADVALAREHLGLTGFAADLITGGVTSQPGSATPGLWNLWGFETETLSAQASVPDPADSTRRIAAGTWLQVLAGRVDVFLQQSGLSYRDLLELFDTRFVNPGADGGRAIRVSSTDPNDPDTCETTKLRLDGFDAAVAARTVRFVRLRRAVGWSLRDLDRAVTAFAPAAVDDSFLIRLSHVKRLQARFGLPVVRLLSWWAVLDTAEYIDFGASGQPRAASLYDQLFRDPATVSPPDPAFTEDPAALSDTFTDRAALTAALGVDAEDLDRLVADPAVIPRAAADPTRPDDRLTLDNLSRLHRHASLSRALGLRAREYLTARALIGTDPFASTTQTLLFVETVDAVRAAGSSFCELDYLLRHVSTPDAPVAPTTEEIATKLGELRAGLRDIAERHVFRTSPDDPAGPTVDLAGDLTRGRLALLNWDPDVVEEAVATLNGALVYEAPLDALPAGITLPNAAPMTAVPLATLPAGFAIPPELTDVVAHDPATHELRALRDLEPAERTRLEVAAAASGDAALDVAVEALLLVQDELRGFVLHDALRRVLRFTGPMTVRRRQRLERISADPTYLTAIQELFEAPRRFIGRSMRMFAVGDFSADLSALPAGVAIPAALRRKLRFDTPETGAQLRFRGVMTEQERAALLSLSSDPTDPQHLPYQTAVRSLYDAPEAVAPGSGERFLTASGAGDDAAALFDSRVAPAERFGRVLRKLLPHLRSTLSEQLAVQSMAEALDLEARSADALLRIWLASPADPAPNPAQRRRCLAELLDPVFASSDPAVPVTPQAFPAQFRTFLLLHKVALVAAGLGLDYVQLSWAFTHGLDAGWLDLGTLPTRAEDPTVGLSGWVRLTELAALRDALPQGARALAVLLARAHTVDAAAPQAVLDAAKANWFTAVTRWTPWAHADLEVLLGAADDQGQTGALGVSFPDGYRGVALLIRLRETFAVVRRLGIGAAQAADLASGSVTQADARGVRQAVRAKYEEAQWLTLAKPLRDTLRERQRGAMVAYLVANLKLPFTQLETPHPVLAEGATGAAVRELQQKLNAAGATPGLRPEGTFDAATRAAVVAFQTASALAGNGIVGADTWAALDRVRRSLRDGDDLYSHLLMDVQMDACAMTSRIKQAIGSVQLFAQRCLMSLEPDVTASAEVDVNWRQWRWIRSYRVWEAGRRVFLYPENWVEWDLRDGKSPFFTDLESELLQADLTADIAEEAFRHYLEKLDRVAHLESVATHRELEKDAAGNTAVDVLHVLARTAGEPRAYFYRQRLDSAYWTSWEPVDLDIEGDHLVPVVWNRRLYLFWFVITEKADPLNVTFTGASLSGTTPTRYFEIRLAWSERRPDGWTPRRLSIATLPRQYLNPPYFYGPEQLTFATRIDERNQLLVQATQMAYGFLFDGCHTEPQVAEGVLNVDLALTNTTLSGQFLWEDWRSDRLFLPAPNDVPALARTPGSFRLLPQTNGAPIEDNPIAYADGLYSVHGPRSFLITPSDAAVSVWEWSRIETVDPGLTLVLPEIYWEEVAPLPDPVGPLVDVADPSVFDPLFEVGPGGARARTNARPTMQAPVLGPAGAGLRVGGALVDPRALRAGSGSNLDASQALSSVEPLGAPVGVPTLAFAPGTSPSRWAAATLADEATVAGTLVGVRMEKRYRFAVLYHPWVCAFVREFNRNGVFGLLQRRIQLHPEEFAARALGAGAQSPLDFATEYGPQEVDQPVVRAPYPVEDVDFEEDGAYALYNWELFFFAPLLIAERLSGNQRYEEAQQWFHTVFDPTDTSGTPVPSRYWRTRPFYQRTREGYQRERLGYLLRLLAAGAKPETEAQLSEQEREDLTRFEKMVARWRRDPFNPHLVARMRTSAYQRTVVMKYVTLLVAWADQLFRRDTIESINEATQLYVLAGEILGRRPEETPPRAYPRVQTYNTLAPSLDAFANALVGIEDLVTPSGRNVTAVDPALHPPVTLPGMLYFCVPQNDKLLGYWDTVADRLFKIRHCMNIEGVVRQLPLFEPRIEPGLLVKAAAAGVDLSSVLSDVSAAPPHYRFNVLAQKATELCAEVKSLGQAVLSALEKRDAERLVLLRAQHDTTVAGLVERVRVLQVDEANKSRTALDASRDSAVTRYLHFQKLLGVQSPKTPAIGDVIPEAPPSQHVVIAEEGGVKSIPFEQQEMAKLKKSDASHAEASGQEFASSIAHAVPNFSIEPWGLGTTFGGSNVGQALGALANRHRADAAEASFEASKAGKLGGYVLRAHDWLLQSNAAGREIMQIDQQILGANIRGEIAQQERVNQRRQRDNARQAQEFLEGKYTNDELYGWTTGQLATLYFQAYQLAYDVAKRAECAFRAELGLRDSSFIRFGYWDSLKKGLLSGERLYQDLKRMEVAYLDQNRRELEITKTFSLAQLDPLALVALRRTGTCMVRLPEALFDVDFAGHYMRRIKAVNLSIPCVVSSNTNVNCTLTLLRSSLRQANTLLNGRYGRQEGDPRFTDSVGAIQSVVLSGAKDAGGTFDDNLRDDRALPFEGRGVISEWRLELPARFRHFEYDSITDVLWRIRYTARDAGALLAQQATLELQNTFNELISTEARQGLAQLLSLRHDPSGEWHRFLNPPPAATGDQTFTIQLNKDRFPFVFHDRRIDITAIDLLIEVDAAFARDHNETTLKLSLAPGNAASNTPVALSAWNGLLRASGSTAGAPGEWTLTAWRELDPSAGPAEHERLDPAAIRNLHVICRYTCT